VKPTFLFVLLITVSHLFSGCLPMVVSEADADKLASLQFRRACGRWYVLPANFEGPTKKGAKGEKLTYKWTDTRPGADFVIVVFVDPDGDARALYTGHLPGLLPRQPHLP